MIFNNGVSFTCIFCLSYICVLSQAQVYVHIVVNTRRLAVTCSKLIFMLKHMHLIGSIA